MTENKKPMPGLVLTAEQIQKLAKFAKEDGQPEYCITHTTIPAFVAEDDSKVAEAWFSEDEIDDGRALRTFPS